MLASKILGLWIVAYTFLLTKKDFCSEKWPRKTIFLVQSWYFIFYSKYKTQASQSTVLVKSSAHLIRNFFLATLEEIG